MVALSYKVSSFVLLVLGLASWVLMLAGTASLTQVCNKKTGFSKTDCGKQYQFEWWGVWFEFFVLVISLVLGFFGKFGGANMSTLQAFYVLVTGVLFIDAQTAINNVSFSNGLAGTGQEQHSFRVNAAGFVLCALFNFILILLLGWGADLEVAVKSPPPKDVEIAQKA